MTVKVKHRVKIVVSQSFKSCVIFPRRKHSSLDDASGARSPTLISEEGRPASGGPYERYFMKYMCILLSVSYVSFDSLTIDIVYVVLNYFVLEDR